MFGRFQLLRLLGKSARTMLWLAIDPRSAQEILLILPRAQPTGAADLEGWMSVARKASRIDHPGLPSPFEVGEHERWPYAAYDRALGVTLAERLTGKGMPGSDVASWAVQALQGLAFAHEAGVAHNDLQPYMLLLDDQGTARIIGLEVACSHGRDDADALGATALQAQRRAAERDVMALGLILHQALSGQPALDQTDIGMAIERMPPLGREIVRLPWSTTHAVPEPLRVIVNRATDRQERQRYRNARTLLRALEGWIQVDAGQGGGPLVLLLDRMRASGLLPASPGGAARVARLVLLERETTNELAEIVLQDLALAFELMRTVNGAQVKGVQMSGNGAVLTIRRALAMLGLEGVRRAALSLRDWPGPLSVAAAAELEQLMNLAKKAGQIAVWIRPAGYDAEVMYLLAMLQNLGRLIVQYHFPDEAQQIRRLMQPAPAARQGDPDDPGMSEESASYAVLGADIDVLGAAVARHWGLDEGVQTMMRRVPTSTPVRAADGDADLLRLAASAANEVVDTTLLPAHKQGPALQKVAQRYGRVLGLSLKDLQAVAQGQAPGSDQSLDAPATQMGAP